MAMHTQRQRVWKCFVDFLVKKCFKQAGVATQPRMGSPILTQNSIVLTHKKSPNLSS